MAILSVQEDGGGNFTTLSACLADAGTGDNDTINIEGAWDDPDVTECTVADDNLTIQTDATAKHIGRPWAATETTYRLWTTGSGNTFTVNNTGLTIDGLDIQNTSTGQSDEVIRDNLSDTLAITIKNSILGFPSLNAEQDIYFTDEDRDRTITFEQCMFYNARRAVIDFYDYGDVNPSATININSCSAYNIGHTDEGADRRGLVGLNLGADVAVADLNVKNTFVHTGTDVLPCNCTNGDVYTISLEDCASNQAAFTDGNENTLNETRVTYSVTFDESDQGAGSYIIVNDVDSPQDLRLQDLGNANNMAQDSHTDATGAGLTIPETDIVGTSRPQNTNYDLGAFEIVAAVGPSIPVVMHSYRQRRV